MARVTVFLVAAVLAGLCLPAVAADTAPPDAAGAPTAAPAPKGAPATPATAPDAVPAPAPMPSAVDAKSLGFGSSATEVERIMGKPTSVVAVTGGEDWVYGRSRVTLVDGKVAGWCKWDKPLPMNIGTAHAGAPPARVGTTAKELAAFLGTPDSVAWFGTHQVWFYGMRSFTLKNGRVVPTEVAVPTALRPGQTKTTAGVKARQSTSGSRSKSGAARQTAPAAEPRKR